MKGLKIFVVIVVLGLILAVSYCLLRVYFDPGVEKGTQIVAIGVLVTVVLGGLSMFRSLFLMDTTNLRWCIKDGFDTIEMKESKERLYKFARNNGDDFAKKFGDMLPNENIEDAQLTEEQRYAKQLDIDRWRYSHLFHNRIYPLLKEVSTWFIKSTIYPDEVEFLLAIIEPMDEIKAQKVGTEYDTKMFDKFRKMYKKELKEKGLEERRE